MAGLDPAIHDLPARSPDERSDIRERRFRARPFPHVASLMRATIARKPRTIAMGSNCRAISAALHFVECHRARKPMKINRASLARQLLNMSVQ
jgi:hypothetical protein